MKFRRLDADLEASGPHAFAVRFRTVRQWRIHVHRIPLRVRTVRQWRIHVHRIPLRVRDDRDPPPWRNGMGYL
jgi:hypothetical protein